MAQRTYESLRDQASLQIAAFTVQPDQRRPELSEVVLVAKLRVRRLEGALPTETLKSTGRNSWLSIRVICSALESSRLAASLRGLRCRQYQRPRPI